MNLSYLKKNVCRTNRMVLLNQVIYFQMLFKASTTYQFFKFVSILNSFEVMIYYDKIIAVVFKNV